MNCRHVERLLSDCMEGLLPERQADRVAEHLRACSACRRLLDELQAAGAALRAPLELPSLPGMERRIAERWIADRAALSSHSRRRLTTRFPLRTPAHRLAAAGLAILLAAALGLTGALFERDNGSAPRGEGDITTPGQQVANSLVPAATRNSPPTANRAAPAPTPDPSPKSWGRGGSDRPPPWFPLPQLLGEGDRGWGPDLIRPLDALILRMSWQCSMALTAATRREGPPCPPFQGSDGRTRCA